MKRVYTLYRVSTKGQVDKDDIPMQKTACHEFAGRQEGWVISKEFYEKGISGYKVSADDRDAIQDIKAAAENMSLIYYWCLCLTDWVDGRMKHRLW